MRTILQGGGLVSGSGSCRGMQDSYRGGVSGTTVVTCIRQRQDYNVCVGYDGVGMLTAAAALTTGLSMTIDGLRVVGSDVCAGGVCFGGRLSVEGVFWCVVVAGYFLVGIQQRHCVVR